MKQTNEIAMVDRKFRALENFEAEDRLFLEGEVYTAFYEHGRYILVAENGEFSFTKLGMENLVKDWAGSFEEVLNT
ncbi:hypothetical protein [Listeria booriae]|uniref:Uncharacterized protein n=1 Tax=Listeria booriae TaxID=1552123 RepID=A0A842FC67_9LIST|nr:hypothetical protein [Listeria booriae]MBC2242239.1 hypothetical protein [Listeria booriae]